MTRMLPLLALALAGCASFHGTYTTGPSKHPHRLELGRDGAYSLRQEFTDSPEERGRWWRRSEHVVALLPDDRTRAERFAWVGEFLRPRELRLFDDLRSAMEFDPERSSVP